MISYGDITNHYTRFHSHGFWEIGSEFCKNSVNIIKYLKINDRKMFLSVVKVQASWKALAMIFIGNFHELYSNTFYIRCEDKSSVVQLMSFISSENYYY